MIYYSSKEPFDFKIFITIRSLGENIYSGKITINEADQEQADLVEYMLNFNNNPRPKISMIKKMFLIMQKIFMMAGNLLSKLLRPLKLTTGTGLKILILNKCANSCCTSKSR